MIKVGLYTIGTSTTLESNKTLSSTADPLILLTYDVRVIKNGVGNRRVGSL